MESELLEKFKNHLVSSGKSPTTISTYLFELKRFADWLTERGGLIEHLTRFDVQSYVQDLQQKGRSPSTLQKIYACVCTFAHFDNKGQIVDGIQLPRVHSPLNIAPKALDRHQKNKLLRSVERDGNLRNIAITYTLLLTGIRVSELTSLNSDDVILGERSGTMVIRNGKGNILRNIPLASEVRYHLNKYKKSRMDDLPPLFLSNFKQRISPRSVQHMLQKYGVHPHLLRHTFCRQLVTQGVDISTVADLAGHIDLNVTRRYTKPSVEELEEAINRLSRP